MKNPAPCEIPGRVLRHRRTARSRPAGLSLAIAVGGLLAVALAIVTLPVTAQDDGADEFLIVVHVDNPLDSIEVSRLSKMFLKKSKRWDDGESIVPFDRDSSAAVRETFTRAVHGKSVSAIKSYWQRMIFSGRDVPPDEVESDEEMLARIRDDRFAVGYVASSVVPGDDVKVLALVD